MIFGEQAFVHNGSGAREHAAHCFREGFEDLHVGLISNAAAQGYDDVCRRDVHITLFRFHIADESLTQSLISHG